MPSQRRVSRNRRQTRSRIVRAPGRSAMIDREYIVTRAKAASDGGSYLGFSLSQFPSSDIISLFTDFRIRKIEVTWMLVNAPNNNANFPTLYHAPQHIALSPTTVPTSRDEVVQYKGVKHHQFGPSNLVVRRSFDPYVPIDANTIGQMFVKSPWLSTNSNNAPHYVAVDWLSRYNTAPDSSHTIELVVKATIECRGTR